MYPHMCLRWLVSLSICLGVPALQLAGETVPVIVYQVKLAVQAGEFKLAREELRQFRAAMGAGPEYIEALSWVGRGELAAKKYAPAEETAAEVRKLALDALTRRKLDADASLPNALGASIEVQAQAAVAQGRRDQAVVFLREEVARWHDTSIRARIQKNLNLLTLEGKPAPALEIAQSATDRKPQTLVQHRGHPVLLFFWAHWCSDCKNEIAVIQKLQQTYGKRGFEVIAPTQHYGYVAGGQDAPVNVETRYIKAIFAEYYAGLGGVETPLSEENFARYGVSTTPTLVLVDGAGVVRLYNPGNLSYEQLAGKIAPLLRPAAAR
jgi:thiol-disulfide isomerase/thioredoxin